MKKTSIKIDARKKNFTVSQKKQRLTIDTVKRSIVIRQGGKRGLPGRDGRGVPAGGLPGQALVKITAQDYDTEWLTPDGSDKYYIQSFTSTDYVIVPHNLLKFPSVTIHDTTGDEVEGMVNHISINQLTLTFSAPFSGIVTCN